MTRRTRISLFKEDMKFSAAHFTIFSASERENLHGHNFFVHVELDAAVSDQGMAFDYGPLKHRLIALCKTLNEVLLLPAESPHLLLEEREGQVLARFGEERLVFLKRDVKLLPLRNITLEELSHYLLEQILAMKQWATEDEVSWVEVRVFSGPGQSASSDWRAA